MPIPYSDGRLYIEAGLKNPAVLAAPGSVLTLAGGTLAVDCPPALLEKLPEEKRAALLEVLSRDPRPRYQKDAERVYAMSFAGRQVRFTADGGTLTVIGIE